MRKAPNPRRGRRVIYGRILRIEAQKTQPHQCDAACKRADHCYYHDFDPDTEGVIYGNPDGSILITTNLRYRR